MASVSTYLNFTNKTEQAFNYYKSIFGGEFTTLQRFADVPDLPGFEKMSEAEKQNILHVEFPILAGHRLMGTDAPESLGLKVIVGNNMAITLEPDSKEEADRLFQALAAGGKVEMPMQDMFWGDYYGSCQDKFGVNWMINFSTK